MNKIIMFAMVASSLALATTNRSPELEKLVYANLDKIEEMGKLQVANQTMRVELAQALRLNRSKNPNVTSYTGLQCFHSNGHRIVGSCFIYGSLGETEALFQISVSHVPSQNNFILTVLMTD